jgi:DNA-binding beta-propeller fold protein YncE
MRNAMLGLVVLTLAATLPTAAQTKSSALLVMLRHNKAAGAMAIVNPATGKITARVRTGEDPHGVAVSADGRTAFVVNTSGKDGESLSVIDVVGQKEIRRLNFPKSRPHDVQVYRGKAYFTAAGQNAIGRYDPVTNQTEWLSTGRTRSMRRVKGRRTCSSWRVFRRRPRR